MKIKIINNIVNRELITGTADTVPEAYPDLPGNGEATPSSVLRKGYKNKTLGSRIREEIQWKALCC